MVCNSQHSSSCSILQAWTPADKHWRRAVEPRLKDVQQRTLLLVSEADLLLPSREEGPRLKRKLKRCEVKVRACCISRQPWLQLMHA